jgi:uncharacterized RDD family membrane protein YckC
MSSSDTVKLACRNHPEVHDHLERCTRCQESFCEDCLVAQSGQRLCAACKNVVGVAGVGVAGLRYATIFTRAVAQLVDGTLVLSVFYAALWATGSVHDFFTTIRDMSGWARLLSILSLPYLYYIIPLVAMNVSYEAMMLQTRSQTLGKILMGIKVVGVDGRRVSAGEAWLRAAARTGFGILSVMAYIDYLAVFVGQDRATLHDRIARTRVVVS